MNENLLQFIWKMKLFDHAGLHTVEGMPVTILSHGNYNTNAGPDFLQARLRIGETTWAGNIEMHVRASDWERHKHSDDSAYANIIAHVVWENDKIIAAAFPTIELKGRVSNLVLNKYEELVGSMDAIPCSKHLYKVPALVIRNWQDRLIAERLQQKSDRILQVFASLQNNWEETCWVTIAEMFGLPVNGEAFKNIALSLPQSILAKSKNQLQQIEAMLLGQAGLLDGEFEDSYMLMLQKEYQYLTKKYGLKRPPVGIKFLRMRPANFPSIRLAQLAMLLYESRSLFSKIKEAGYAKDIQKLFEVKANDYWNYHYKPADEGHDYREKPVGRDFIDNILINGVAPLLYSYGVYNQSDIYKEKALVILENTSPEKNAITRLFQQYDLKGKDAYTTQSLIQLYKNYCTQKKCLQCSIGNQILKPALS